MPGLVLSDNRRSNYLATSDVMLTIDGQVGFPLKKNDSIVVRKADVYTKLVRVKKILFEVVRLKFREEINVWRIMVLYETSGSRRYWK